MNYSKHYAKGKKVTLKDGDPSIVGIIQFANHRNDRYEVMWKKPGGERWMQLQSRWSLLPYKDN